jgi:hypothetical protein
MLNASPSDVFRIRQNNRIPFVEEPSIVDLGLGLHSECWLAFVEGIKEEAAAKFTSNMTNVSISGNEAAATNSASYL